MAATSVFLIKGETEVNCKKVNESHVFKSIQSKQRIVLGQKKNQNHNHIPSMCLSVFYCCDQSNSSRRKHLTGGLLTVSEAYSIVIVVGIGQALCWGSSWELHPHLQADWETQVWRGLLKPQISPRWPISSHKAMLQLENLEADTVIGAWLLKSVYCSHLCNAVMLRYFP